jgi:hypothetical protein
MALVYHGGEGSARKTHERGRNYDPNTRISNRGVEEVEKVKEGKRKESLKNLFDLFDLAVNFSSRHEPAGPARDCRV